jgi:hypothetical protein
MLDTQPLGQSQLKYQLMSIPAANFGAKRRLYLMHLTWIEFTGQRKVFLAFHADFVRVLMNF